MGYIQNIFKNLYNSITEKPNNLIKIWVRTLIDVSLKRTYKWPTSIGKDV